jgi:hypothetical protein
VHHEFNVISTPWIRLQKLAVPTFWFLARNARELSALPEANVNHLEPIVVDALRCESFF